MDPRLRRDDGKYDLQSKKMDPHFHGDDPALRDQL
jgi:hypothetical protein